ncbi:MAG: enoyl-CoA hydratase/isomerase family protein [Planctomycetes bacterium]|nr:enoyl-CoA hydratase/isomerase family protein [Planctomycetota bacterium]
MTATAAPGLVLYRVEGRVATITVNRPDKLNALDAPTLDGLRAAFERAQGDDAVRVVILTGAGERAFIAGADIAELAELTPLSAAAHALRGQALLQFVEHLGKPVIAMIRGYALGGGCEVAMACTIRIASTRARLGQPEVKLGLIPGYGGTQRLPRLVGKGRAMEVCLVGEMISAEEALRIGLVNRVVPPESLEAVTREVAEAIAARAPLAARFAMEAIQRGVEVPLAEGLRVEADLFGRCAATRDMREGTTAFLEKREPVWEGR